MEDPVQTINNLKKQLSGYKSRITFFKNKLNKNEDTMTLGDIQSMHNRLQRIYNKYDDVQSKYECIVEDGEKERYIFENNYGELESKLLTLINEKSHANISVNTKKVPLETDTCQTKLQLPLPEINLPIFDGSFLSWINFRNIFTSLIHTNEKISGILKFHYLNSCLKVGKAFKYIENLSPSATNYDIAWKQLFEFYENESRIKKKHMKEIYNLPKVEANSESSLQSFIDSFYKHYQALQSLNVNVESWDLFLTLHLTEKLDLVSRRKIEGASINYKILTVKEFMDVLKKRVQIIESNSEELSEIDSSIKPIAKNIPQKPFSSFTKSAKTYNSGFKSNNSQYRNVLMSINQSCPFCSETHSSFRCTKFLNLTIEKRIDLVKELKLCTNCFSKEHFVSNCKSGVCRTCFQRHHTLIHWNNQTPQNPINSTAPPNIFKLNPIQQNTKYSNSFPIISENTNLPSTSTSAVVSNHVQNETHNSQVLLSTAIIWVSGKSGCKLPCRVLIDTGSQSNFVTENLCQKLFASKHQIDMPITGISKNVTHIKYRTSLSIYSRVTDFNTSLEFLVIPKITGELPLHKYDFNPNCLPSSIQLADPKFYMPQEIDMLLGAEIYCDIVSGERINVVSELPPFQKSVFGYILSGKIPLSTNSALPVSLLCTLENINEVLQKFWKLEEINNPQCLSIEEKQCEEHYSNNVRRQPDGRYSVALPVKPNFDLGQSSEKAYRQYQFLERNLIKNKALHIEYNKFLSEYLSLHHMEEVKSQHSAEQSNSYFLPHHAVLKPNSTTTNLRVVFNGSSKTTNDLSLNDILMVGPTIQQDIFSLLLRFRKYLFGVTADITKMYRQVLIHENQRHLQRIWWRKTTEEDISCFQLCTVTYGTASAPFLAIRTLKQLAIDERNSFPNASILLEKDFYVDDFVSGTNNKSDLQPIKEQMIKLLARGGFDIRKWKSNCKTFLPTEIGEPLQPTSVLGLVWDTETDTIKPTFCKYQQLNEPITKRVVLSGIAQTFDPLGLFAPITFTAKVFMQQLWSESNLDWDDELTPSLSKQWQTYINQLQTISDLSVPRCVAPVSSIQRMELHGFGDASERGYGCCIYIRSTDTNNQHQVRLLCAKSKVAPLKRQSIPRLELCASLLLAQLYNKVHSALEINFDKISFWTDSEITLHRIKSAPSKYVTFVANRIAQIQEFTSPENWNYVPTEYNPADIVSRGLMPLDLEHSKTWWYGPQFLKENDILFPQSIESLQENEYRKPEITLLSINTNDLITQFSDLNKLLRITSLCRRFIANMKCLVIQRRGEAMLNNEVDESLQYKFGSITADEINNSLLALIKVVQHTSYNSEIVRLKRNLPISLKSPVVKLNPFMDSHGIIRVGGRLKYSNLSYDQKHNILLPGNSTLSQLIAHQEHLRNLHCGPQSLLNTLRQRFWITNGRNLCRKIFHSCIRCFRVKPANISQLMGELPPERVTPARPFESVGIDFCGPFNIKYKIRTNTVSKVYIALFVCFSTKATHLEIVSDLTTPAFIATLRRFISRRGHPSAIYTDNATNFIGAQRELQNLTKLFETEIHQHTVLKFCSGLHIKWQTIPPRSPHFGGLWESSIKSAKHHLKRTLFNSTLTFEELQTIVNQVEACLNSRPLTPMSSDPSDLNVLTPGHFLIGTPLNSLPDPSLSHLDFNRLSRWQKQQYNLQSFWKRWSNEYLNELQTRNKWFLSTSIKLNTLVLIKDDNIPPMKWIIGRIIATHPGSDGHIRVVTIKTAIGEFKRAVTRICVLPIETASNDNINPSIT